MERVCENNDGKRFVLPAEFVTVEPLTDYTDVPAERLAAIGSGGMDLPAIPGSTQMSLREKADDVESQISLLAPVEEPDPRTAQARRPAQW